MKMNRIFEHWRRFASQLQPECGRHSEPHRMGASQSHLGTPGPKLGHDVEQNVADPDIRYGIIDAFNAVWRFNLENLVCGDYTIPPDQIIDYPPVSDDSRYTFSLSAFPDSQ